MEGGKLKGGGKKLNDGFIEGSIIHGTRFSDSTMASLRLSENVQAHHLVDADDFINDNFNQILHGKKNYYPSIKKLRTVEQLKNSALNLFHISWSMKIGG